MIAFGEECYLSLYLKYSCCRDQSSTVFGFWFFHGYAWPPLSCILLFQSLQHFNSPLILKINRSKDEKYVGSQK